MRTMKLKRRQAEKVQSREAAQSREEKAEWRPHSNLPVYEGALQGSWRGTFPQEL